MDTSRRPVERLVVPAVDYHTAGEPFRIVTEGLPAIPGATVRERREHAIGSAEVQRLRELLCNEPRGHAGMYGGLLVPPDDPDGDLGVLFWHREGFSTACGHGTIALGIWAAEEGLVEVEPDGETEVVIDVPSGRVVARVRSVDGTARSAVFRNVPSYVIRRGVEVTVGDRSVLVDFAFSGAIYASVAAADLGLGVEPVQVDAIVAAALEIKRSLAGHPAATHSSDDRLSGIYGVIFHDPATDDGDGLRQRNVTVFADGEVDRSPCGSGTSARLVLLHDEGRLGTRSVLHHESIVGTTFDAWVAESASVEGRPALITEVRGSAHRTGEHRFLLASDDPLGTGFQLI